MFRVSALYVNDVAVEYEYDADGMLTTAGALVLGRSATTGQLLTTTLGTVTSAAGYDQFGALAGDTVRVGSNIAYAYALTRDSLGRVTSKTEMVSGTTTTYAFAYDSASRLSEVKQNDVVSCELRVRREREPDAASEQRRD